MRIDENSNSRSRFAQNSHALSSSLNVLIFSLRVDESFLFFFLTLDGLPTTLVLVWPGD